MKISRLAESSLLMAAKAFEPVVEAQAEIKSITRPPITFEDQSLRARGEKGSAETEFMLGTAAVGGVIAGISVPLDIWGINAIESYTHWGVAGGIGLILTGVILYPIEKIKER